MLLARIQLPDGSTSYAEVLQRHDGSVGYLPVPDPFEPAVRADLTTTVLNAEQVSLLAPCRPRLVIGMAHNTGPLDRLLPPQAFLKSPHSVVGPGVAIELDPSRHDVDAEAELAVVIGTRSRHLTPDTALAAVYGYTCANDVTDRAAQATDSRWTEAKSRDTFTPLGPWITTELDPSNLDVELAEDAGTGATASTAGLARSVVEVLVYLSSVMTLHPGDVILTGAPGASRRLRPGRTSEVRIPGIGTLRNPVTVADSVAQPAALLAGAR